MFGKSVGIVVYGIIQLLLHLLLGWPAYILLGATGYNNNNNNNNNTNSNNNNNITIVRIRTI